MDGAGVGWTSERIALLKKLWAEGISCSQIADDLGGSLSRNAVIGKVHRLGLPGRERKPKAETESGSRKRKPKAEAAMPQRPRPQRKNPFTRSNVIPLEIEDAREAINIPPNEFDRSIPVEQRKSLLELTADHCRFPIGDVGEETFFFCGGTPKHDSPYCPHHHARAFTKPSPRTSTWNERRRAA